MRITDGQQCIKCNIFSNGERQRSDTATGRQREKYAVMIGIGIGPSLAYFIIQAIGRQHLTTVFNTIHR